MPKEMIVALTIIFALFCLRIARQIWLLRKEKPNKGGQRMGKHFNGRFRW